MTCPPPPTNQTSDPSHSRKFPSPTVCTLDDSADQNFQSIPSNVVAIQTQLSRSGLSVRYLDSSGIRAAYFVGDQTPAGIRLRVSAYVHRIGDYPGSSQEFRSSNNRDDNEFFSELLLPSGNEVAMQLISEKEHVIFVLAECLAMLPLSCLKFRGKYLILEKQVSHVLNLSLLGRANVRQPAVRADLASEKVRVITRPGSLADLEKTGYRRLPMAGVEGLLVADILMASPTDAKNVTASEFRECLRSSTILHVATHGFNDTDCALDSSILLQGRFRVRDISDCDSHAALVVFSACNTSRGCPSGVDGDYVQGFPESILVSGAKAYLGTLWEVNDVMTMIHMYFFYACLFTDVDMPCIAEGWRRATRRVYELDVEGVIQTLQGLAKELEASQAQTCGDPGTRDKAKRSLMRVIERLATEEYRSYFDLKDPFFWAAFSLTGNASQYLQSAIHPN